MTSDVRLKFFVLIVFGIQMATREKRRNWNTVAKQPYAQATRNKQMELLKTLMFPKAAW
jgi:hypothetical protein